MSQEPDLWMVGLSHRTADLEIRDRVALAPDGVVKRLEVVIAIEGVEEAWLISTCNRTELLVATPGLAQDGRPRIESALREVMFSGVPDPAVYTYRGVEAVLHLFRVSAGLDSLVLGESQILSQIREAHDCSRRIGATKALLEPLLQQALSAGKRVRNETSVGAGTLSVARAAVDVAERVFGRFQHRRAVVVGAGETGVLAAKHLAGRQIGRLHFVNRTLETAQQAAASLGYEAAPLDRLAELLLEADLLLVCVDGAPGLVTEQHFDRKALRRRDRPMVTLDLSVPRAIDPRVAKLRNVIGYDLDHLIDVVDKNRQERVRASEEAAPLLLSEVHKFLGLRAYASYSPTIMRLRERFEAARERQLDECVGETAPPEMVKLAHRLTKQLMDISLDCLKESARDSVSLDPIDRAYQRFLEESQ